MRKAFYAWLVMPAVFAAACSSAEKSDVPKRTVFFDKTGMDTTVSPGENFFQYANGAWMKNTVIPASETGWGSFYVLYDENQKNLRKILDEVSSERHDRGSLEQKVGDLYKSGMDTVAIDKRGYEPVKPMLARIDAVKDVQGLIALSADSFKEGDGFLFGFSVGPDDRISTKNALNFYQTGLGLPNRDYYFNNDPETKAVRDAYKKYIVRLFTLTGTEAAAAEKIATDIIRLETEIAGSHLTPVELRDPVKNYNKFTVAEFQKQIPGIPFRDVLDRIGAKTDTVLVSQPKYYQALNKLLRSEPVELWKNKLKFELLNGSASYLSKEFRDARFDFAGRTLNGQKQQKERWKLMVETTDNGLGELLGQLYVRKYFPQEAKDRMLDLVNNLQKVYEGRIKNLDWMSPETKSRALAKLNAFTRKIGYPDKWKNYDDVEISPDKYYENQVSDRVGNDPAHGQRLLQPELQRDRIPGRHPAVPVLRRERG